jgi:hypothetical protein
MPKSAHHETPTNISQLVGFIASPNPQIRMLAAEGLIPYSVSQPAIFKTENLLPVKNLTLLTQDHPVRPHAPDDSERTL